MSLAEICLCANVVEQRSANIEPPALGIAAIRVLVLKANASSDVAAAALAPDTGVGDWRRSVNATLTLDV
jgi:hypothetical protein